MKSGTRKLLLGVGVVSALAGAKTVATRVVQVPVRKQPSDALPTLSRNIHGSTSPQARGDSTLLRKLDSRPRHVERGGYAERLLQHAEQQYRQHRSEVRETLRLRRRGEAVEAGIRLGAARLDHARAVGELNRILAPALGGSWRQKLDQLRLDVWFERRRSRWMNVQREAAQALPAASAGTLRQMLLWIAGGSRTGAPQELVEFHRQELRHYRRVRARARRYVRDGLESTARAELFHELAYHFQRSYAPMEPVERW
jgi:hypothetical protein